jgi:hypothetical protein
MSSATRSLPVRPTFVFSLAVLLESEHYRGHTHEFQKGHLESSSAGFYCGVIHSSRLCLAHGRGLNPSTSPFLQLSETNSQYSLTA